MDKVLILLSGGIDSIVMTYMLSDYDRQAIGFDYEQPHKIELQYAQSFAENLKINYSIIKLPKLFKFGEIFCGRNALMLSYAFSMAQSSNIKYVAIGTNKTDHEMFPDCRLDFLLAMSNVANVYGITLLHPLSNLTKTEIIKLSRNFNIDLSTTWTCYAPVDGIPCGECYSCVGRTNALN